MIKLEVAIISFVAAACIALGISSCSTAHGSDMHIESLQAADGTWCYVVVQNGSAAGLSCK